MGAYPVRLLRTIRLAVTSPAAFCRNVIEGTTPLDIVSPKALIATLLLLFTFLGVIFPTDEERDRSWLLPLAMIQISQQESFERAFPGLRNISVFDSFVQELRAVATEEEGGESPVCTHFHQLLNEKVTWNSVERYIASKDTDLALRYHDPAWIMNVGQTFREWWQTIKPVFYWYVVCLLMHLSLPARDTSVSRGIKAQQYIILAFMLIFGLPMFVFEYYEDTVPYDQRVASTLIPVASYALPGVFLLSMVIALRAIARAYRQPVMVIIGIFCLIASPIAIAVTAIASGTSRIVFIAVAGLRDPDSYAAADSLLWETWLALHERKRGKLSVPLNQFGLGIRLEVRPASEPVVVALIRNGAAQRSGEIKVGDTILMLKKNPTDEWVDLKSMDADSIKTFDLGERDSEIVLLVRSGAKANTKEVTLRRKRLYRLYNPLFEIVD